MKVPANQLRKGDIIRYSSHDLQLASPYMPLEGEIIRIAYTSQGMRITTASGSWECSRRKHYDRITDTPILGKDSWPTKLDYSGSEKVGGKSIE